ncbi:MAG: hypothetical protein QM523_06470 [Candidatus Pacebacteria bacterium]|nr:hypothetical protein [Candidatus Paceibacterota bacterium]
MFIGLLGLAFLVVSCDLHPIYLNRSGSATNDSVNRNIAQIKVMPISDRSGQLLRNRLEDRVSAARAQMSDDPESLDLGYGLTVSVSTSAVNQGEQINASSTYGIVSYTVKMTLVDLELQKELFKSSFLVQRSFSLPRDGFAELTAVNDAHRLSMIEISQTIMDRLQVYFDQLPPK